jgi:hypothetical protein
MCRPFDVLTLFVFGFVASYFSRIFILFISTHDGYLAVTIVYADAVEAHRHRVGGGKQGAEDGSRMHLDAIVIAIGPVDPFLLFGGGL